MPAARPVMNEKHAHIAAPIERDADPWVAIGHPGDRDLERQCEGQDHRDEREQPREAEAELVADVGREDGEGGAVEFVDRVEPEQDQQCVAGAGARDRVEPSLCGGGRFPVGRGLRSERVGHGDAVSIVSSRRSVSEMTSVAMAAARSGTSS